VITKFIVGAGSGGSVGEVPVIARKKVLKNNVEICAFCQAKDNTLAVI